MPLVYIKWEKDNERKKTFSYMKADISVRSYVSEIMTQ